MVRCWWKGTQLHKERKLAYHKLLSKEGDRNIVFGDLVHCVRLHELRYLCVLGLVGMYIQLVG